MNEHAMKYVAMAQRMASEDVEVAEDFAFVAKVITQAEIDLVRGYGRFRDLLKVAADAGNETAKRMLDQTYWDLT